MNTTRTNPSVPGPFHAFPQPGPVTKLLATGVAVTFAVMAAWSPLAAAAAPPASAQTRERAKEVVEQGVYTELSESEDGTAYVIVMLQPVQRGRATPQQRRAAVTEIQDRVLAKLAPDEFSIVYQYENFAGMTGRVNAPGLGKLAGDPDVVAVGPDGRGHGHLDVSVPFINADDVHAFGYTGDGITVAVLDTGIDNTHADLSDNIAAGWYHFLNQGTTVGPGAVDNNGHGTNVSGIITSKGVVAPVGVAPDTDILAVKVLDFNNNGWVSDWVAGVDYVVTHKDDYDKLCAINMSLGTDYLYTQCPCDGVDTWTEALSASIQAAKCAGIVTFASSGNDCECDRMPSPPCLSAATAVAAVETCWVCYLAPHFDCCPSDPDSLCVDPDEIACFSNRLDECNELAAPGVEITAPGMGGGTSTYTGTSQAAPHVTGVAALMCQKCVENGGSLTPDGMVQTMKDTGVPTTDLCDPLTSPNPIRVDALSAVNATCEPKWEQLPNVNLSGLHCHDEGTGWITLADDFLCEGGDITTVEWWGNYEDDDPGLGINHFRLSLHECAPGPQGWCVPSEPPLWVATVPFAAANETDSGLENNMGETIYHYSFDLPDPYPQIAGMYYWFDVGAFFNDPTVGTAWRWQEARRDGAPPLGHAPAAADYYSGAGPWQSITWPYPEPEGYSDMAFRIISEPVECTWFEDFDSYVLGSGMHGQGGWKGWDNDPASDAFVTNVQARSAPHSVDIEGNSDLVHEYSGCTSGDWTYTAWMYVPGDFESGGTSPDRGSYFILLNTYNDGGPYHWSVQLHADSDTNTFIRDGVVPTSLPLITDRWVKVEVDIDLDNDLYRVFYDGVELGSEGSWTAGVTGGGGGVLDIATVDLFANDSTSVYWDDMSLVPGVVREACCLPDGSCVDTTHEDCVAQGGDPQGPGTACLGDPDGDGVEDPCDNCPSEYNPDQNNSDATIAISNSSFESPPGSETTPDDFTYFIKHYRDGYPDEVGNTCTGAAEEGRIETTYSFDGDQAVYLYAYSGNPATTPLACHRESGMQTTGAYDLTGKSKLGVWITDYTHSSDPVCEWVRTRFRLDDGVSHEYVDIFNDGQYVPVPPGYDDYVATATGTDGRTWRRFEVDIPEAWKKPDVTITILTLARSWCAGWTVHSEIYADGIEVLPGGDSHGDACDNCWYVGNPDQSDGDDDCPDPPYDTDPLCGDACDPVEVCCLPDGSCIMTKEGTTECTDLGGSPPPAGAPEEGICEGDESGNGIDDACEYLDEVVCEPQGGDNPTHPPTYWYDVTPDVFGRCDFHVRVYDANPANYTSWNITPWPGDDPVCPTAWRFAVHQVGDEWWASWWDSTPGCQCAFFDPTRFEFTNNGGREQLDQYQESDCNPPEDGGSDCTGWCCEHVGPASWDTWQEFVPTAGKLTRVEVKIARNEAEPNEVPITMTVESPLGNVLTSATVQHWQVPEGTMVRPCEAYWISFDVADITLTPGQSYYIVLSTAGLAYHWCAVDSNEYLAGTSSPWGDSWDWTFRTYLVDYNPSTWGDWTTTTSNTWDPYLEVVDSSDNHPAEPDGGGYRVHVPEAPPPKWVQPPMYNPDSGHPECFWGWDSQSVYDWAVIVADDFPCDDEKPITDIHWWGSYCGWEFPEPPPLPGAPVAFHIGLWTNVPAGGDEVFSHPGMMIKEWTPPIEDLNETLVGCDFHDDWPSVYDYCYRYDFIIPEAEWFHQEPACNVYWISIAAIYPEPDPGAHEWGWKTRPHYFEDDAVQMFLPSPTAPVLYDEYVTGGGDPIERPEGVSWDMAFVLTTEARPGDPQPAPYPHNRKKNRYISFDPNKAENDGLNVAFKVELKSLWLGSCSATGAPCRLDMNVCSMSLAPCQVDEDCPGPFEWCISPDCGTCSISGEPCNNYGWLCALPGDFCVIPNGDICVNDQAGSVGMTWWLGPEHPTLGNDVHLMVSEPYRRVSTNWPPVVHAADCEVVPIATYGVRAVDVTSGAESAELEVGTIDKPNTYWADGVGPLGNYCTGNWAVCVTAADCPPGESCIEQWPPPEGFTNFNDVTAAVFRFQMLPGLTVPNIPWVDMCGVGSGNPRVDPPDYVINFSDIQQIVLAFQGWPYLFNDPADCPDTGNWP